MHILTVLRLKISLLTREIIRSPIESCCSISYKSFANSTYCTSHKNIAKSKLKWQDTIYCINRAYAYSLSNSCSVGLHSANEPWKITIVNTPAIVITSCTKRENTRHCSECHEQRSLTFHYHTLTLWLLMFFIAHFRHSFIISQDTKTTE